MDEQSRPGFTYEETNNAIKIATRHDQNWSPFLLAIISFLALMAVIIFGFIRIIRLVEQELAPATLISNIILFMAMGLMIYILYEVARQALDNAFLQEDVEITGTSITIEKSGFLMFRKKKMIPAGRIQQVQPTIQLSAQNSKLADLLMNTSKISKISITTRQRAGTCYPICRGISVEDTVTTLDGIHDKFPRYW